MTRDDFEKALLARGYAPPVDGGPWVLGRLVQVCVPQDADAATLDALIEKLDEIVAKEKAT